MTNRPMTNTFLDKARGVAQQAVAGAQDALSTAQHKLDDLSRRSQLDAKLATLGAAFYAEQRTGGERADVDRALEAVDAHVETYGWTRDPQPPATDERDLSVPGDADHGDEDERG